MPRCKGGRSHGSVKQEVSIHAWLAEQMAMEQTVVAVSTDGAANTMTAMANGRQASDQAYEMEIERPVGVGDQEDNMNHEGSQGGGDHGKAMRADEDDGDDSSGMDSIEWETGLTRRRIADT